MVVSILEPSLSVVDSNGALDLVVGLALIVGLVAAVWKRPTCCRRKKKNSEPRSAAPTSAKSAWNQGYRELDEPEDDADRNTEKQKQKDLERGKV